MVELVLLILSLVISAAIGIFVYSRNPRNIVNQLYALLTVTILLFSLANYLSLHASERLFYIRMVIFFASAMIASLYFLIWYLSTPKSRLNKFQICGLILTATVLALSFTSLLFKGLTSGTNPVPIPSFGAALFVLNLVGFMAASFILLIRRLLGEIGNKKNHYQLMLIGITPMFLASPITGFFMPVVLQNPSLVFLSPIYATFFVSMVGYAILRHGLFDIRPVIARTIGYLISLAIIGTVFTVLTSVLSIAILGEQKLDIYQEALFVMIAIFIALSLSPLKNLFDKLTNRIFYRDAYDPQDLIDELNQILVSFVDMTMLLDRTAELISEHLKVTFCEFYIHPTTYLPSRIIGRGPEDIKFSHTEVIDEFSPKILRKVLSTDEYLSTEQELKVAEALRENNISVVARLVNTVEYPIKGVGYLFMGAKKSGSAYTGQDLKIIEIIANELVIAIENILRYEEIEKFNVTLQKKIDDATGELKRSNDKLRALDEAKDEFVSMASHQLRTPLTSIKGYVSMVAEEDVGKLNADQKKMLGQALFSSQRMVYLISDLLNVSRLKTGKFIIEAKPVNLPAVIESELEQLKEGASAKDISLNFVKPKHFPILNLDEMKIRQVIMNFSDNAIYYTPNGGKITLQLHEKKDSIEFTVKDTGIGVPKEDRHKLFTKFYRANNAKKARPDGTGLGLFMAKKVIIAQGGSVIFDSVEGKGSTFGFSFPKTLAIHTNTVSSQSNNNQVGSGVVDAAGGD